VRGGKREAQTALAEMVTEAERGLTVRTTATVGELLEAWFEFAAPDFSPKTVKETRGVVVGPTFVDPTARAVVRPDAENTPNRGTAPSAAPTIRGIFNGRADVARLTLSRRPSAGRHG
jgi:hypothetical protein